MKRTLTITIKQEGKIFFAFCKEMPDVTVKADSKNAALEKIRVAITKKLGDDPGSGSSPKPHPHSPTPPGPIIVAEAHELPE